MNRMLDTTTFAALGSRCAVRIVCSPVELARARMAAGAARAEIIACERVLSRFDESSELARVNAAPRVWTTVDVRLVEAVDAALRYERETAGKCSPLLLSALVGAGYDRSFEQLVVRDPRPVEDGGKSVQLDREQLRVRVSSAGTLDLGGTAKGVIGTRALHAIRRSWPAATGALVDLGGDIAVTGFPSDRGPWRIDVADARHPGRMLGAIALASGGVASSGRDRRRLGVDGERHHLIDPSTGRPAEPGPLAVTVIAPSAADAEAHATALAITPVEHARRYLSAHPRLSAIVVPAVGRPLTIGHPPLLTWSPDAKEVAA